MSSFGYLIKEGFRNLWCNRTMTIASIAILTSCILLTCASIVFSLNVSEVMRSLEANNSFTVYLDDNINTLDSIAIGNEINALENVESAEFISKDDAIKRYINTLGAEGEILEGLTGSNNPLPNAFRVTLVDLEQYQDTVTDLGNIPGVVHINDYSDVANKLLRIDRMVSIVCYLVVALLGVVSLFIISNTIRVTMFSRKLEISIMKSVGATNTFIRIPFVIEGMFIGLLASILSSIILVIVYTPLAIAVSGIMASFNAVPLSMFIWYIVGGSILGGMLFGMLGSLISMGRYLNKEGNRINIV